MRVAFREVAGFAQIRDTYFVTDDNFARFQYALIEAPERGDVMQHCGGLRKVRWIDIRRGQGRGGLRVIYLYVPDAAMIYLIDVYDKNEAEDITPAQKNAMAQLAQAIREEAKQEKGLRI